jgi:hypothetical protein
VFEREKELGKMCVALEKCGKHIKKKLSAM